MSDQLRILVIANLPPWVLGGAENQVARLVETWAGLGHRVEVAGHRIPTGRTRLGAAEIAIHRIAVVDWLGRLGRAASYFFSLARLLSRIDERFDIVYSRGLGDGAIAICLLKAMGRVSLPLVACPINARGAGDTRFIRSIPGWRWIARQIDRHCNAINVIAPAVEQDLADLGIRSPHLSHIPNGIALAPPIARGAVSPVRRLIWTGRLSPQKGLDLLLSALSRVATAGRDFRLEIIGEGPDLASLTDQCRRLGLDDRVTFAPATDRDAIRGRLAAADVFVLPSRYEGMSNAGLEAMEAGLPLVLTRCGGLDTHLDANCGWICEPEDVRGLTDALLAMLDTPDETLLAMGRKARERVEQRFEIESIGRRNAELLASIAHSVERRGV